MKGNAEELLNVDLVNCLNTHIDLVTALMIFFIQIDRVHFYFWLCAPNLTRRYLHVSE